MKTPVIFEEDVQFMSRGVCSSRHYTHQETIDGASGNTAIIVQCSDHTSSASARKGKGKGKAREG